MRMFRILKKQNVVTFFDLNDYRGGGANGTGIGDHKPSQHNQQSASGRNEHRSGHGDQPGQYATLSKQCKTLESSDFYWGHAPSEPGKQLSNATMLEKKRNINTTNHKRKSNKNGSLTN